MRIEYAKTGRLRYLSHLEVVRAMERVIRRSGLPVALSQGFNVHMRHAFGPALPVGTAGLGELYDIWLDEYVPPQKAHSRLAAATVPGLPVRSVCYLGKEVPSVQKSHVLFDYLVVVELGGAGLDCLEGALDAVLEEGSVTTVKKGREKSLDLAVFLPMRPLVRCGAEPGTAELSMTVHAGESGSLRPETLMSAILTSPGHKLEGATVVSVTRTALREPEQ
jgi:radical SAM-linked protein